MGHIVNPISLRLGVSKYWKSSWAVSSKKSSYSQLVNQDIFIQEVFWGLFHRRFGLFNKTLKNLLPGGITIVRAYNKIYLFCDFYYTQTTFLQYLLFSYFNKFFSLDNLKSLASRRNISLNKNDLLLYKKFKEPFLVWSWHKIIQPIQSKYWLALKKALSAVFGKLFNNNKSLIIYVRPINEQQITAIFLARFIATKLEQGVSVRKILNLLQNALSKLVTDKFLLGYKIKLSGRFSRVQQASCSISSGGVLSRNEVISNVDYAFQTANLKFSVCGIKVLLSRPLNSSLSLSESSSSAKTNLSTWLRYIPSYNYSRAQYYKLQSLLENSKVSSVSNNVIRNYL